MSGSIVNNIGRTVYQLGFEISPILFSGGIAEAFPGGYMPIIIVTEAANFISGLLAGSNVFDLDNFFAHFTPIPGGTLASYSIGMYPFANQSVAANSIMAEPLKLSMRMAIPVNKPGGHTAKLVTMMALQKIVQTHANMGGTYTVVTPANLYTNLLLTGLTDVSQGGTPIPQNTWQWDFIQPLVTLEQADAAMNNFMTATGNGIPTAVPGQ